MVMAVRWNFCQKSDGSRSRISLRVRAGRELFPTQPDSDGEAYLWLRLLRQE
jgi:hypothetical protein